MRRPGPAMTTSNQVPVDVPRTVRRIPLPQLRADTRRALPVILPVTLGAGVALVAAVWSLASGGHSWEDFVGMGVLLAAAILAEAYPVPIEGVAVGSTSLATIFLVAVAVIDGWDAAAVVGFLTMTLVEVGRRRPASRILFNCAIYVLAGTAAGACAVAVGTGSIAELVFAAILGSIAFYLVDIVLLVAIASITRRISFLRGLRQYVFLTAVPFAIMASLTVILVVLWDQSPFVAVILVGPLLATALYQRWIHRSLERLREFDRLKDEFIAVVSHELRTPLTSVYGAAMTLGELELDEERRNALLHIVSTESARLARLLDDILWVSRLDSGRADVAISDLEPVRLVSEVLATTRVHLPDRLSLDFHHPADVPAVAADPDKLRQVLVNLVENAVKYSTEGQIDVRLEPQHGTMRFSVSDQGLGIPVEEQDRIFEKFHRLDPEMTRGVGGTGLGLYICKEIIEQMHGRIWVESERGVGSTFAFELPLARTA
jgi:signal transduction histidine kinase